ncbi:MAG: hypothetical protein ACM3X6_10405 [Patescibacteria group bacterium]
MTEDRVIHGAAVGLAAGLFKNLLNLLLQRLGLIVNPICHYAAGMFLPRSEVCTPAGIAVGWLADLILSAILGIFFLYYLAGTGSRCPVIKGAIFGAAGWFALYGGLTKLGITCVRDDRAVYSLIQFALHVIFGLSLGLLVRWRTSNPTHKR